MQSSMPGGSKVMLWTGRFLSALVVLSMVMSGIMKLAMPADLVKEFTRLGWGQDLAPPIGILELVCVVLYVIPRTSVLGAILLTGYLGGAVATHVRINDSFISPVIMGLLVWGGLFLRDERVRALIPVRQ